MWGSTKGDARFSFSFRTPRENGRRSSAFNSISLWGSVRFEGDETGRENDPNLLQLLPCVCWNFLSVIAKRYEFFSSDFHQMSDS